MEGCGDASVSDTNRPKLRKMPLSNTYPGIAFLANETHASSKVGRMLTVGQEFAFGAISASKDFAVVFEDDGVNGYFYALNVFRDAGQILDVVNIYRVEDVSEKSVPCEVS